MSNFLRAVRKEKGIIARKVAQDLGFSRKTLYRKESGQTLKKKDIELFSKYYKISKREIIKNYEVR